MTSCWTAEDFIYDVIFVVGHHPLTPFQDTASQTSIYYVGKFPKIYGELWFAAGKNTTDQ